MRIWLAPLLLLAWVGVAQSQQGYPNKSIRLIVPWSPGGGADTSARMIAQPLARRLGQSIVIENRPGAGGNIGTEQAARTKPDGYTLLLGSVSPNAINVHLYSRLGFDPVKDFEMIVFITRVPNILVVPGTSPHMSAQSLLSHIKANPGTVNYGSGGVGSSQHLATSMLISATKIEINHVPYKSTSPAQADLIGGHVSMMLDTTACLPFVRSGQMRALAVAARARSPSLPNVPTFDELGIPGIYSSSWYGLMAPAGIPPEVINLINAEVNAILATRDMQTRLAEFGGEVGGGSPGEFLKFVTSEVARYATVVKASGAKAD